MKSNFITGLAILLPFTLTVIIVSYLFNLVTAPVQGFSSKVLAIGFVVAFTALVGFLGRQVFLISFFHFGDHLLHRIPLVRKIYTFSQDFINIIFNSKSSAFKQVALVPFPNSTAYTIALLTEQQAKIPPGSSVSVFIPGMPNPTTGYMLRLKYEEIVFIDMKVEAAFEYIVSCGIMPLVYNVTHTKDSSIHAS